MSEETHTVNIRYTTEGLNESVRGTQRYLFFLNRLRLSSQDLQTWMSGPTLQNTLWTTIQLTRVWTSFHRIVKATNQEQAKGVAGGAIRGAIGGGAGRFAGGAALGQTTLAFGAGGTLGTVAAPSQAGFLATLAASMGIPLAGLGAIAGTAVVGAGLLYLAHRQNKMQTDWRKRQREVARSQGLEF